MCRLAGRLGYYNGLKYNWGGDVCHFKINEVA